MDRQELFDHMTSDHRHTYHFRPTKATLEEDHGAAHASVPTPRHLHREGELTRRAVVGMLAAGRDLLNAAEFAMGQRRSGSTGLSGVLDELDAAIVAFEPSAERYDAASRSGLPPTSRRVLPRHN
jgi:hypothetical protein